MFADETGKDKLGLIRRYGNAIRGINTPIFNGGRISTVAAIFALD